MSRDGAEPTIFAWWPQQYLNEEYAGGIAGWLVSISMGTPIVCINVGEHGFGCLIISNFCQVF